MAQEHLLNSLQFARKDAYVGSGSVDPAAQGRVDGFRQAVDTWSSANAAGADPHRAVASAAKVANSFKNRITQRTPYARAQRDALKTAAKQSRPGWAPPVLRAQ